MLRKRIISLFFGVIIILIIGLYISYIHLNQNFIWIAGILLLLGTVFNWFLYNKYFSKR